MNDTLVGGTLGGYEIQAELGRGAMGVVYRAFEPSLNRQVALKVLPRDLADDPVFLQRFRLEAQAAAKLIHTNIVIIYAVGADQGQNFISMEFVSGRDLQGVVRKEGPLPWGRAIRIIRQAASALELAHANGIIHRDIKPHNLMIAERDTVKVMDFGIAALPQSQSTGLTMTGQILGTPAYMSPEQCQSDKITAASDIYSLGVAFYYTLTGKLPFEAETPLALMMKIVNEEPRPIRSLVPDLPSEVRDIVLKAIRKNPAQRYAATAEMIRDIDYVLNGAVEEHTGTVALPIEASILRSGSPEPEPEPAEDDSPLPPPDHTALEKAVADWRSGPEDEMADAVRGAWLDAADAGDTVARLWYAALQVRGDCGVPRDIIQGRTVAADNFRTVERIAMSHDPYAWCVMGIVSTMGLGTDQNYRQALWWFRKAAEGGVVEAAYQMGLLFRAEGFLTDVAAAFQCMEIAAANGYLPAVLHLAQMYHKGEGGKPDIEKAVPHYNRAAEAGSVESMFELSQILISRPELNSGDWDVKELQREAARRGHPGAQEKLRKRGEMW